MVHAKNILNPQFYLKQCLFYILFIGNILSGNAQQAISTETFKIAIVDLQYLLSESLVSCQVNTFLDAKRKKYHEEMLRTEQFLRQTHKNLYENQAQLSKTEFALARQDFENQLNQTQRLLQEQKQELEHLRVFTEKIIKDKINDIIMQIFQNQSLDLVLWKDNVTLYSQKLDITGEIMQSLNTELPLIDLTKVQATATESLNLAPLKETQNG